MLSFIIHQFMLPALNGSVIYPLITFMLLTDGITQLLSINLVSSITLLQNIGKGNVYKSQTANLNNQKYKYLP